MFTSLPSANIIEDVQPLFAIGFSIWKERQHTCIAIIYEWTELGIRVDIPNADHGNVCMRWML